MSLPGKSALGRQPREKGPKLLGPILVPRESVVLEVNSKTQLHLPPGVNRTGDPTKVSGSGKSQTAGIRRLEVVEDVGELQGESGANTFGELDVLGDRRVHIPPIQAS